jgi:hypothetical protein
MLLASKSWYARLPNLLLQMYNEIRHTYDEFVEFYNNFMESLA